MEDKKMNSSDDVIGLFYGGFVVIGVALGALIGFFAGGGAQSFASGGWINVAVGVVIGAVLGCGLGLMSHGMFSIIKKK